MDDVDGRRRLELGAFLRKARERAKPERAQNATQGKRRTPGLRREEVAERAGVSVVWYTWLEQGRDIQASAHVLAGLSTALELSKIETDYVLRLGRPPMSGDDPPTNVLPDLVERLLDSLHSPATVVDRYWNIIGFNRSADLLLGLSQLPIDERHALKMAWRPGAEQLYENWTELARAAVSQFRTAYALNCGDPRFLAIVDELSARSPLFAEYWAEQRVDAGTAVSRVTLRHPIVGPISVYGAPLQPLWLPDIVISVTAPADQESAARLSALIEQPTPTTPATC